MTQATLNSLFLSGILSVLCAAGIVLLNRMLRSKKQKNHRILIRKFKGKKQ